MIVLDWLLTFLKSRPSYAKIVLLNYMSILLFKLKNRTGKYFMLFYKILGTNMQFCKSSNLYACYN